MGSRSRTPRPGALGPSSPPSPRSPRPLTGGGIHREAAAPRQPGGPGEGLALPPISCSPSPIAMGEGAGG